MDLSVQKILKSPFELEGRVNKIIFLNLDLKKMDTLILVDICFVSHISCHRIFKILKLHLQLLSSIFFWSKKFALPEVITQIQKLQIFRDLNKYFFSYASKTYPSSSWLECSSNALKYVSIKNNLQQCTCGTALIWYLLVY